MILSRPRIEMILRYSMVALLIIYSHPIDATSFESRKRLILEHLRKEKPSKPDTFIRVKLWNRLLIFYHFTALTSVGKKVPEKIPSEELIDIVCDELSKTEKQLICDEMMRYLISENCGPVFESFSEIDSRLRVPEIVDSRDPYKCTEMSIRSLGMKKRMFWCKPRWYNKKNSLIYGDMKGFFCSGSRTTVNRVYAFRPSRINGKRVIPLGEMNGVALLLRKMVVWSLR